MKPILTAIVLLAAATLPPLAAADGVPGQNAVVGVPESSASRVVTIPAGGKTVVARIDRNQILASRVLPGQYFVPPVAYDGSPGGVGSSPVVLHATTRVGVSAFDVLQPTTLAPVATVRLTGMYGYDAISPSGERLYLIHYTSPSGDPRRYEVRSYDLGRGRLDPDPIVDPREPDEQMNGDPLTRAYNSDGRWAFTLYDGSDHPFVHALDTMGSTARCIDLDWLAGRKDLSTLRLAAGNRKVRVRTRNGETLAVIDTGRWEASPPGRQVRWGLLLGAAALVVAGLGGYVAASRRRAASTRLGGATSA